MNVTKLLVVAGTLCLASACGGQKSTGGGGATAQSGRVNISTEARVSQALMDDGVDDSLCATFTITPYAPSSDGSSLDQAGSPVTFTTSDTSTSTAEILGCIDGTTTFNFPEADGGTASANWGYLVSATDFVYCADGGTPTTGTLAPAPAFYAPVNCVAGQDESLSIDYPISISSADPGGYIDISAGVSATTEYVGCKKAEIVDSEFHFGESNTIDSLTAAPLGLVGFSSADDSAFAQYGGQTYASNPNGDGNTLYDTYFTGQFTAAAASLPQSVFQTFLTNFDESHLFGGTSGDGLCAGGEWVDTRHAYCMTTGADGSSTLGTASSLADAFLYLPGTGYAAASVASGGASIVIYSQMSSNSGSDFTGSTVITADASPGFAATATTSPMPGGAGFNDGLVTQSPPISPAGGMTFTGVYIDPTTIGQFIVGESDGANNYWASLSQSGGAWSLGNATDITAGLPPGFGAAASGCIVSTAPAMPSFHLEGTMNTPRYDHTETALKDGRVLITGGFDGSGNVLSSAELFDPNKGAFTLSQSSLSVPRINAIATLLPDGRVLVAGGTNSNNQPYGSADLYDPTTDTFTPSNGSFNVPRYVEGWSPLADGRVLFAGGQSSSNFVNSAEIYDPATDSFTLTQGTLTEDRDFATATLLPNGLVLISGGYNTGNTLATTELYDPVQDAFTIGNATFSAPRNNYTTTSLADGRVLFAGGTASSGAPVATADLYDPGTDTITSLADLPIARADHTATLLPNGQVLIAGGDNYWTGPGFLTATVLFDPVSSTFSAGAMLLDPRAGHTAALATGGQVVLIGGENPSGFPATAEVYY